jgi:FlaA1/EpsC-like NDP-sugar epimerase
LLVPVLGDVTDPDKLERLFRRHQPDIVFHAAAYKHVPMLEAHPDQGVYVNVQGTLNLCGAAVRHGCERFVFVSTDKAVHPVNVLGFSKRIGEMIVRAHTSERTIFCSVRFGNVVGSRGSALPEFIRQIDAGGPVTVTHPDVERYFMTIPEAVSLVIQAGAFAGGGELFMLDMGRPIKIADLVQRIIRLRGLRVGKDIEIVYTGLRPGEKLTEDLMFEAERAAPTPNPTILAVADETPAERQALEQEVGILLQVAAREDSDAIRRMLEAIASGRLSARGWLDSAG